MQQNATKLIVKAVVAISLTLLASGCGVAEAPTVDPKGPIALAERDILFRAFAIMMIIIVPVFVMAFWFAWRYRASNQKARYDPEWTSNRLDAIVWMVPALIVLSLAIHVWIYSHELDPYERIDPSAKPLEVEVIAQDWKWLFLYPEQQIATVNELVFPSAVPIRLKITSDTVMNSFFIPALGGQIYAMAGMQTQLNSRADAPGRFVGRNTQYSGDGFSDQHFAAVAMSKQDFDAWMAQVRQSPDRLDAATYTELAKPSIAHPVTYYSTVEAGLFDAVIRKYRSATASHRPMAAE